MPADKKYHLLTYCSHIATNFFGIGLFHVLLSSNRYRISMLAQHVRQRVVISCCQ